MSPRTNISIIGAGRVGIPLASRVAAKYARGTVQLIDRDNEKLQMLARRTRPNQSAFERYINV